MIETTVAKMRNLEDERSDLGNKVRKLETELTDCELSKESLRREKQMVTVRICTDVRVYDKAADLRRRNFDRIVLVRNVSEPTRKSDANGRDLGGNGSGSSNGIASDTSRATCQIGNRQISG